MSTTLATMTAKLAQRLDMGVDGSSFVDTLKATAFKGQVTDAQMVALLVVANQYALNPWTKEIYAFPDRNNGIIPVVGVDGWSRIINSNEAFDGMDFQQDDESCTCIIYRKDRTHPIKVTEYMSECKRTGQGPWQSHPKRMLRHKTMIQCARIAFGYVGIYDPDEAERISEGPTPPTVDLSEDLSRICSAPTLQELQSVFSDCWKANTGKAERDALTKAKDERKQQLTSNVVEVSDAAA